MHRVGDLQWLFLFYWSLWKWVHTLLLPLHSVHSPTLKHLFAYWKLIICTTCKTARVWQKCVHINCVFCLYKYYFMFQKLLMHNIFHSHRQKKTNICTNLYTLGLILKLNTQCYSAILCWGTQDPGIHSHKPSAQTLLNTKQLDRAALPLLLLFDQNRLSLQSIVLYSGLEKNWR